MQNRTFFASALLLLVGLPSFVVAAANQPNPPVQLPLSRTASLSDHPWQWQSTRHTDGTMTVVGDPTRYTIAFEADESVVVRADCNTVLGVYEVSGSQLSITLGPSTVVGCPADSQADEFLTDLEQVARFAPDGDNLQLGLSGGGQMLMAPHPLPALAGPTWRVTSYNNGRDAVVSIVEGSDLNAVFGDDGRVTGSSGCNRFMGAYHVSDGSLTIGPLASTRMLCEQALMDQEAAFLKALESSTQYHFENDMLVLRDASGAIQAMFALATQ